MKFYALLFFYLFLSACSRLDLAVSYAPRYIANEVDDALDFNSERYNKIKRTIASDIEKNKKDLIYEVIIKIEYLQMITEKKDLSIDELRYVLEEFKNLQKKAIYLFKPSFSEVIMSISRSEVEHLDRYAREKFRKSDERLAERQKYYRHYFKNYEHYMDIFFNSNNKEQDELFKDFLDANYDYYIYQNEMRKMFLKQFEIIFDKKSELLNFAMQYYAGEKDIRSGVHIKKQEAFNANMLALGKDLWKLATVKQKLYFKQKLAGINEELRNLVKE